MSYYANIKKVDLRRMLQKRGLQPSGNKEQLISRLSTYDIGL